MIAITVIETGYSIKFPFELKDNFRETFKSAKWNAEEKAWEVGKRSKKRLEKWLEVAEVAAQEIEKSHEAELTKNEVAELETAITNIRANIAKESLRKNIFSDSIDKLSQAKEALAKATSELAIEKAETSTKMQEVEDLLAQVCDLDAISHAHNELKYYHGKIGADNKEEFRISTRIIKSQCEKLRNAGFKSEGLDLLSDLNFNRPDRDNPSSVLAKKIYNISRVNNV